jgi:hypothetical protein
MLTCGRHRYGVKAASMQVVFTCDLEELAEWRRKRLPPYALDEKGREHPIDTSKFAIRTDEQIRDVLWHIGMTHHFEINLWFSFVSWTREPADGPNSIRIVVEGDGPQFKAICQAITSELSN